MSRLRVCREDELEPGEHTVVSSGDVSIGVFNVDGEFFALLNRCLHQYGPLCEGSTRPKVEGTHPGVGERVEETLCVDDPVIECPWHGWSYDVKTGSHTGDEDVRVPTYDTVVEDGTVYVET